jgi:hypothetical protein
MTRGSLSRGCGGPFSTAEWIKMRHGTKHALALPRGVESSCVDWTNVVCHERAQQRGTRAGRSAGLCWSFAFLPEPSCPDSLPRNGAEIFTARRSHWRSPARARTTQPNQRLLLLSSQLRNNHHRVLA